MTKKTATTKADKKRRYKKAGNPKNKARWNPKYIEEAQKLATIGCSKEDIAWMIGIHPSTLYRWVDRHRKLKEALEKGIASRNSRLRKAMFDNAITNHNTAVQIFLAKNWLGMSDKQELQHSGSEVMPLELILNHVNPNGSPDDKNGDNKA